MAPFLDFIPLCKILKGNIWKKQKGTKVMRTLCFVIQFLGLRTVVHNYVGRSICLSIYQYLVKLNVFYTTVCTRYDRGKTTR